MKKLLFAAISFAVLFSACSNDVENIQGMANVNIVNEESGVLSFSDIAEFQAAVEAVEQGGPQTRSNVNFKSLYDEYEAAWEIEEEYYTSKEKYNEFKKMFPHLYFPEYEDDYSFFLPVSDENIAKLVNPEGNVMIDGKLVNYIDIKTPQDLLELGLLCPNATATRGAAADPSLQQKIHLNSIPKVYNTDNDRRMWVDTSVSMKGGYFTTTVNVHFNKAAIMGGWKKYRSEATLIGTLTYASGSKTIFPVTSTKRGKGVVTFDAVDRIAPSGTRCYGYDMKIRYQGIEGEYRLTVDTDKIVK